MVLIKGVNTTARLVKKPLRDAGIVASEDPAFELLKKLETQTFRAAEIENILDFPAQYSPPATVITLERNYRSTQGVLDAAWSSRSIAAVAVASRSARSKPKFTVSETGAELWFPALEGAQLDGVEALDDGAEPELERAAHADEAAIRGYIANAGDN